MIRYVTRLENTTLAMDDKDKSAAIQRYAERITELGPTVQALGWRDEAQQQLRFAVLSSIGSLDGKSVLDVGCGFGDFYGFLRESGVDIDYKGIDISPDMLSVARKRYPEAKFDQVDLLTDRFTEKFDFVVESGIFNHRVKDNEQFVCDMMVAMYEKCRLGIAANMMTTFVDYRDAHLYYYEPMQVFAFAKSLSKFVTLRHDYPLYEFSIFIYRQSVFMEGRGH